MSKRLLLARIEEQAVTIHELRQARKPNRALRAELARLKAERASTARTQQLHDRFVAQVATAQRERPPDSADLQIAKHVANVARGVLLKLEWSGKVAGTRVPCCPICHATKGTGHLRDCTLFQVIGPPRLADTENDDAAWAAADAEALRAGQTGL